MPQGEKKRTGTAMLALKRFPLRRGFKLLLPFCIALGILLLVPLTAYAHAQYLRSNPAANARLESGKPPTTVQVWFSEQIDPSFSKLEVFNKDRQRVDAGDSHIAPNDTYSLIISMRPGLPDGPYTVVFRNVSAEDGHEVQGSFSFVVGGGPLPAANADLLGAEQTANDNFNIWSILVRWLNYLGMAGLVGCIAFFFFVWRPAAGQLDEFVGATELEKARQGVGARMQAIALWSLITLAVGWLAFLIYQASIAGGSAPWEIFSNGALSALLFKSRFGTVWLVRLALIIIASLMLWLSWTTNHADKKPGASARQWLLLFPGIAIMLTTSLNAHAAANKLAWLLVPADSLHLVGTSFWIGGVLMLVLALPLAIRALVPGTGDRTRLLAVLIPRFSTIAIISVAILVLTGLLQAFIHLGTLDALFTSSYGQALCIKLVLFIVLLGLGAFNLLKISPRMSDFAQSSDEEVGASSFAAGALQRTFQRSVRIELGVMIALLIVVGGLTSLGPPQVNAGQAPQSSSASGGPLTHQGQAGDISYRIAINPGKIGYNTFELELKDKNGKPVKQTDAVIARFLMLDMDMGVQEVDFKPIANKPGYYSATDSVLSMAGDWQISVLVRRTGFDDVKDSFQLKLQAPGYSS
ncbi:hypothetical protein EPA93_22170 [Ktedonosporobacter rubrisoli]|uniref:Copper resistance protein CopC n=1 Tax=Ktedonosporobacter rubrisoli TaxID=2509675 RepID=A0A4P6JTG1_KTERU|nr:CopD family protein [Ktedonosporobacter rubrisoli]QBD78552.1 hypothetical protein EPA93_22170 [Ktedonosporobacter rubrisoli]